ncbi:MAG: hypothetical protein FWF75_05000 [Propionibacteriaceae bacterium]|nr:hypothetical protein [Propionibacteriaceae bacterium]
MDRPRVRWDFNCIGLDSPQPLSHDELVIDSDGNRIALREGLRVHLYEPDRDWYDRPDALLADGVVTWHDPDDGVHGPQWCVRLDDRGAYHESDLPGFVHPAMTPAQLREKMYQAIERSVKGVPDPDRASIKSSVATWLGELRRIDAAESATDASRPG